ncbi:uncharacterized protein LOC132066065 [Lycium ferocissimum]|uniref:uncharacterized protein LOC132066065 n=1 Tax=Lycium ferocissimum TaxID=112874 RepID=UPI0028157FCD|nr:uncharacterized protein LOC132066065 [Lycium ferocissimum]
MAENMIIDKVVGESGASNSKTSQTQTVQSKKRKERRKRSVAWTYFDPVIDPDGNEKGVWGMLGHIPKCKKIPRNVDTNQAQLVFKPVKVGGKGDVVVAAWKFNQETCRKALCRMVIIDELPFRFVEKEVIVGEDMAKAISKCLRSRGYKRFSINYDVDNTSSNDVTVKELSKQLTKWGTNLMTGTHLHVRCMAHIINLVIQDGIKESIESIERVRQTVRCIKALRQWGSFRECCEDVNLVKKSLCLDVPTRWNSTYLMLNRDIEYEGAILHYADRDIGLSHHLEFVDTIDGSPAVRF